LPIGKLFAGLGTVYRETDVERAELETIIADLMSGCFEII
jgi:hypothetical protein